MKTFKTLEEYHDNTMASYIYNKDQKMVELLAEYVEENIESLTRFINPVVNTLMRALPTSFAAKHIGNFFTYAFKKDPDLVIAYINEMRVPLRVAQEDWPFDLPESILVFQEKVLEHIDVYEDA